MSIKKQFYILIALVISAVLLIFVANQYSTMQISRYSEQQILLLEINSSMLSLRRHEKDFFARNNLKYINKFNESYALIIRQTQALAVLTNSNNSDAKVLNDIKAKLDIYRQRFMTMRDIQQKIGLSAKLGLYGELRKSVHLIEELLSQHNEQQLMIDMLMLRRHEKDFMLRTNIAYIEKFEVTHKAFKQHTLVATLSPALKNELLSAFEAYSKKFHALAEAYQIKGLTENLGLRAQMRAAVHEVDIQIEALEEKMSAAIIKLSRNSTIITSVVSFSLLLLILFVLVYVSRSITLPIIALRHTLLNIASSGRLSNRIQGLPDNEIGQVGDSINQMLSVQKNILEEVTKVVTDIADGHFDTRIVTDAQGDFADLKKAVNRSCDNIANGMFSIVQVLASLQQGNFKQLANLSGLEGSYLTSAQSANDTMVLFDAAITDISAVMSSASKGDFSKRVRVEVSGDLRLLKQDINLSMDAIEAAVIEIVKVSTDMSKGQLKQKISTDFQGQLALILSAIGTTLNNLQHTVGNVHNMADEVQSGARDIALRSTTLDGQITKQVSSLSNLSQSMAQLTKRVEDNVQSAQQAKQTVNKSLSEATDGLEIVDSAMDAMQVMKKSSAKISEIISVINNISFQTSILALNATVEAARSSEGGKGFSVVAKEMGSLATQTSQAAKDVDHLINDNSQKITSCNLLLKNTESSLQRIHSALEDADSAVANISITSAEQSNKIQTVHKSISQLEHLSNQNANLVSLTSTSSSDLDKKAIQLTTLMEYFKLQDKVSQYTEKLEA